jgi:hypothetical protein
MNPREIDAQLTDILADLYPDANGIPGIVRYVGYDTDAIDFGGAVHDVWGRVVQWARSHRQTRGIIDFALKDAPLRSDLQSLSLAETGRSERDRAVEQVGTWIIENIRADIRAVEERLTRRIDDVDAKVDTLKANTLVYTSTKRNSWMAGFVLFCLPTFLFLNVARDFMHLDPAAAMVFIVFTWVVAAGFFLYGMGYVRNL